MFLLVRAPVCVVPLLHTCTHCESSSVATLEKSVFARLIGATYCVIGKDFEGEEEGDSQLVLIDHPWWYKGDKKAVAQMH